MGNRIRFHAGGRFIPLILQGPMLSGLNMCFRAHERGEKFDLGLAFKGFDFFGKSILVMVAATVATFVLIMPAVLFVCGGQISFVAAAETEQPLLAILGVICWIIYMVLIMFITDFVTTFAYFGCALIVDFNLEPMDAIKLAWRGYRANFGGIFGHCILGGVLNGLMAMCCGIPAILFMPVLVYSHHVVYNKVFPSHKSGSAPPVAEPANQ